ncbi:MAG: MFS transporter [Planctomycetes bacterium]|nr:MFS transporter [Planctomycetota bacterium]
MPETAESDSEPVQFSPEEQARGRRTSVTAQLFGILGMQAFKNGILLLYMTVLGFGPGLTLVFLSLPDAISMIFRLPIAYMADRHGKKKIGSIGLAMTVVGFSLLPLAGFVEDPTLIRVMVCGGLIVMAVGKMFFASSWFALLSPFAPEEERGRMFGRMRIIYTVAGIAFAGACSLVMSKDSPVYVFQIIVGVLAFCFLLRFVLYQFIPELETTKAPAGAFWTSLLYALRAPGYASFCAYVFLLMLFTAGCGSLFSLVEKSFLSISDGRIVFLANAGMVGGLLGHYVGGKAVDRFGSKYVFMICHFFFAVCIASFVFRGIFPLPLFMSLILIHFLMGFLVACSGIAITTEMLGLAPKENKSLSTSICMCMWLGGSALSGFVSALVLDLGVLKETWVLGGLELSSFDSVLLAFGGMIFLMVVTLGMVPSVLRKAEWMPRDHA